MSAEVESGLTAASSGGEQDDNQNKPDKERADRGQGGSDKQLAEAPRSPADVHKKCKDNDKENEQSSNVGAAVEAVKKKVVEAPPPKVNPWTKRTTGRVPVTNVHSGSQERGEDVVVVLFFCLFLK